MIHRRPSWERIAQEARPIVHLLTFEPKNIAHGLCQHLYKLCIHVAVLIGDIEHIDWLSVKQLGEFFDKTPPMLVLHGEDQLRP